MIEVKKLVPELRFKGFDEGWNLHKLGELGTFKNGLNKDSSEFGHGSPFVNLMDVFGKSILTESNFGLVNSNEKDKENYNLVKGDVLFIRSSVKRTGVGETILVAHDIPNTVYSGFLIRFRDRNKELGLNFKSYCFSNAPFRKELLSYATSSANTNINQESLAQIKLFFPSLPEQQKIASFLSAVDEKIQQLTRKKELLEQYKKGVMQQLFSGKLRFKDENGAEYPEWEVKRLGEVLDQQIREVKTPLVNYLAIGVRSHVKGTFQKPNSDPSKIAMDKLYIVHENDLIVNITFAWEGAIAVVKKIDDGGLVSHRFPTYIIKANHSTPEYFKHIILDKKFRLILDLISPGGAGRNRVLSKKEFVKIKIHFPCIDEQQKIANFLSDIDKKIESNSQQINQTQTFKKGLLQKMFV